MVPSKKYGGNGKAYGGNGCSLHQKHLPKWWGGEGNLGKHAVERTGVNVAERYGPVKGVCTK